MTLYHMFHFASAKNIDTAAIVGAIIGSVTENSVRNSFAPST